MAEVINTNVFNAEKKFVDFAGLDYFWGKAKTYIDGVDATMSAKVGDLENTVGDSGKGLVKDFNDLKATVDALGDIEGGEGLGGMIDAKIAALDVEDAAVDGQYVSSVSETDGKITVTRATLPVYEKVGTAEEFNTAMDERVKVLEAIDHEQLAADASAAAVATVLDGAPEKFDTLKEIAAWIAEADTAEDAASLVTRVATLEAIDHDAYVGADETNLQAAKDYAEGLVNDLTNGAVKANTDAIAVINGEAEGSIAKAKADAIAQAAADAAKTLEGYYTKGEVDGAVSGAQAAAEAYAKTYTDALFTSFKFAQNSDIDGLFA